MSKCHHEHCADKPQRQLSIDPQPYLQGPLQNHLPSSFKSFHAEVCCFLLFSCFLINCRITDDLPFPRRTITSIILYNFKLPCRETLLSPPAIKRVHLIEYSHMPSNYLPDSVTRLSLSSSHNLSITPHLLPLSLTHLHLPAAFNGEVDDLPQMLTHLKFGYEFNQPVCIVYLHLYIWKYVFILSFS